MSLATRMASVEHHNLAPKEAVILWMREAHQFGSYQSYARWLIDQPDDASLGAHAEAGRGSDTSPPQGSS